MPQIPQYTSQVQLTKQVPAVMSDPQASGMVMRAVGGVGDVLADFGQKIQRVKTSEEAGRGEVAWNNKKNAVEVEASQDQEPIGFDEKYQKKLQAAKDETLAGIKDPLALQELRSRIELDASNSSMKLKKFGWDRLIEQRKMTLDEQVFQTQDAYLKENNPALKQQYLDKIASSLSQAANEGVLSKDTAARSFAKIREELPEKQAEWDILNNPSFALGELQKGQLGLYKDLPTNKRVPLIKDAETRIEKIKNREEERISIAQNQREADLIGMKVNGDSQLTEMLVKQEMNAGNISQKFSDSLLSSIKNPKIPKSNNSTFNKMVDLIFNDKKDSKEVFAKMLTENAKGELTDDELKNLTIFNQNITKNIVEKQVAKQNPKSFWQAITFWSDEYAGKREEIKADMFKDFIKRVNSGEDPNIAIQAITKKQAMSLNPVIPTVSDKGQIMTDKFGNKARVFPDGRIEEIK